MLAYTRKVGVKMNKTKKAKRVIPGFGLSMGVTISILSIIVLIPLASLVIYTAQMSWSDFIDTVTSERVMASYQVSLITAFIASAINAVMGVVLAWVLVRYKFPGKRIIDGMIELPFALPTAVATPMYLPRSVDSALRRISTKCRCTLCLNPRTCSIKSFNPSMRKTVKFSLLTTKTA